MTRRVSCPQPGEPDHTGNGPRPDGSDLTPGGSGGVTHSDKRSARRAVLDARSRLDPRSLAAAERAVARHLLDLPELRLAHRVGAYVSMGTEPGTDELLQALLEHGAEVLLPVLLPDNDLDWSSYTSANDLVPAAKGLREPSGPRLGPEAVLQCDVLVVPGLAVDPQGRRLGRGGGSYDRVLARVEQSGRRIPVVLLLHEGEVDLALPVEEHDRGVDIVVTPGGVLRYR